MRTAPYRFVAPALLLSVATAAAQVVHASGPLPAFEVVSIKRFEPKPLPPAPPGEQIIHQQVMKVAPKPPNAQASERVRFIMSTRMLIGAAFNLPLGSEGRVVGGPDWVNTQQYQVNAKIEDAAFAEMQKMPPEDQRQKVELMEQALLADRFHLKVHFEKRPHDAYDLVVAKGGPKLTTAQDSERTTITMGGDRMVVQSATIADWIHSIFMNSYDIVDKTGLTGRYDFTLTFSPRVTADEMADSAPPLRAAVQDQLGLKLEPTKSELEYIIIDHVEQPSEN